MNEPRGFDARESGVPSNGPRRRAQADDLDPVYDIDVPLGRRHADPGEPHRHLFTRSLIATGLSTLIPGLGLVRSRRPGWGIGIVSVFLGGIAALIIGIAIDFDNVAAIAVRPKTLTLVSFALATTALAWVAVIVGTHLVTRPPRLTRTQRAVGALAVGGLSFLISAPLAVGARYAYDQGALVQTVFKTIDQVRSQTQPSLDVGQSEEDTWASKTRLNILLLGGDNEDVEGGLRTDTIMVASIDTLTGDTTIFQIPRNTGRMPFPADSELAAIYPNGFYDGVSGENPEYMANAIWKNVPLRHPDLFTDTDQPGADALKMAVGEALGLQIDYYVMLRINGLINLIDAMGGIVLNVNERIPLAGSKDRPDLTRGY
ncbi:MAG TPA: LCP family protein, partial [Propionibacteriaceae bacterium]|nr:LCP family protein [Propionibacteriaceae bacterium]